MSDNLKSYNANTGLKAAGQVIGFTKEQLQEYLKCVEDPIYFINNYCCDWWLFLLDAFYFNN